MILKCINHDYYHLTVNKLYKAELCLDSPSEFNPNKQVFAYYIINDLGFRHGVEGDLFINISEHRDKQLNKLGL